MSTDDDNDGGEAIKSRIVRDHTDASTRVAETLRKRESESAGKRKRVDGNREKMLYAT